MKNIVYIEECRFYIENDSTLIRDTNEYLWIKSEINKPIGNKNWEKLRTEAESLAKTIGVDLVIACYYTAAAFKTKGIEGLANGLSLISHCLYLDENFTSKQVKTNKSLIDWVTSKVTKEIKVIEPCYEELRDLYRCERECQCLDDFLEKQQSNKKPSIEGVSFEIFKHIEKLETKLHLTGKGSVFRKKKIKTKIVSNFLMIATSALITFYSTMHFPVWLNDKKPNFKIEKSYPSLLSENKLLEFSRFYNESQHLEFQMDLVELYLRELEINRYSSVTKNQKEALQILTALLALYPSDASVIKANKSLTAQKKQAEISNQRFLALFKNARTNMVNISNLAQKEKWKTLKVKTTTLENFAVSLSPIYGRIAYIEELIEKNNVDKAGNELKELKTRIQNLIWKIIELESTLNK